MQNYPHVEDYIELLAGYEPGGNALIYNTTPQKFSLARYDVNIVDSMASHTVWGGVLTDKQADLCVKLVLKYKRQFAQHGVSIETVEADPEFRNPPRKIDRSKRIWLEDDKIKMRFPYERASIDAVHEYKAKSQGSMIWDPEHKIWTLALTEANVNWAVAWGQVQGFEIDPLVQTLYDRILASEDTGYEIKLTVHNDRLEITNAESSLVEYVETKLGGFGLDNLVTLIDYAGVLGYSYDCFLTTDYPELTIFNDKRQCHVPPSDDNLSALFDYAELTNRYPICIYDPSMKGIDLSRFKESEIVRFDPSGKTKTCEYNIHDVKVVYANKIPKTWEYDVPLLISTVEMMYGGKRVDWLARAEKVVYFCKTLLRENN